MSSQAPISDFQLECFRAANDRLLFRVKRRENWLKIHILLQVFLVTIGVFSEDLGPDYLLHLPLPLAFIFSSLYVSEDRLVGHIVSYLNALSQSFSEQYKLDLLNLESSPEGRDYTKTALPVRLLAQVSGFLFLPLGITGLGFISLSEWESGYVGELVIWLFLSALIAWLLINAYRARTA